MILPNKIKERLSEYLTSKFVGDSIWLLVAKGVLAISGIALNVIIGNYEGSAFLGVFNQVLAFYMLIGGVSSLGLSNFILKKISGIVQNNTSQKEYLSTTLFCSFLFSIIAVLITLSFSQFAPTLFSDQMVAEGLTITVLAIPLYNSNKMLMARLQGIRNLKIYSISKIIRWFGLILLITTVALLDLNQTIYFYVLVIIEAVLFFYLFWYQVEFIEFNFNQRVIKESLSFGLKTYISEIVSNAKNRLDIIIAGYFLSKSEMGIFTFIYSIALGFMMLSSVLIVNINPLISRLWDEGKKEILVKNLKKVYYNLIVILIPFLVIFVWAYYNPLPMITDIDVINNHHIFLIMLFGILVFANVSWLGGFLIMTGHLIMNIYRTFYMFIFGILSMYILSSLYGLEGAAIAIMISALFNTVLIIFFVKSILFNSGSIVNS